MAEAQVSTIQTKASSFEDFLVEKAFITKDDLAKASSEAQSSHRNLYDYLVSERYITEEDLTKARGLFFNLPYIDLRNKSIAKELLEVTSKTTITTYKFMPFELVDNLLKVALTDPTDLAALGALEFLAQKKNLRVELYITSYSSFSAASGKAGNLTKEVTQALKEVVEKERGKVKEEGGGK